MTNRWHKGKQNKTKQIGIILGANLGDEGVIAISDLLMANTTLTVVNLDGVKVKRIVPFLYGYM